MASVRRTFTLPETVSSGLDEEIPSQERSAFIADTLERALRERKRTKLLTLLDTLPRKANPEGVKSEDVLREIRDTRADDILDNSAT